MRNVTMKVEGKTLRIEVDLSQRLGPSKSGKTEIVASTDGISKLSAASLGQFGIGLNVFTERKGF